MRRQAWQRKLSRPVGHIKPKRGELITLADARSYILGLKGGRGGREYWQGTIKLLLEAADGGDIEQATRIGAIDGRRTANEGVSMIGPERSRELCNKLLSRLSQ